MIEVEKEIVDIYFNTRKVTLFKIITDKPYYIYRDNSYDMILESKYIIDVSYHSCSYELLNELESLGYDVGLQCMFTVSKNKSFKYQDINYAIHLVCKYNDDQISLYDKYKLYDVVPFYTPILYHNDIGHINIGRLGLYNGLKTYSYNILHGEFLPRDLGNGIITNIDTWFDTSILMNGYVHIYVRENLCIVTEPPSDKNSYHIIYDTWIHSPIHIKRQSTLSDLLYTLSLVDGHIPMSKYSEFKDIIFVYTHV